MARPKKTHDPFRYFGSSPEVIRLMIVAARNSGNHRGEAQPQCFALTTPSAPLASAR